VETDQRGWVQVDDQLRTNVPGVYAIGDVTGVMAGHDERMEYKPVPAATVTHPEVASVGLTEAAARSAGHDVVVGQFPFSALGRAQTFGSTEGRELIGRARAGRLAAQELSGGTFTVSNLGMFGVDQFTAVINPPEAAILAVGAALAEPVATDAGGVAVHRRMRLTLSIDHRALDGATGAGILTQLKTTLEHPSRSSPDHP
jgi:hypothetical protein